MMPQATPAPISLISNQARNDRISVDIIGHMDELVQVLNNPRIETILPKATRQFHTPIIRHREHAQYPLHNCGKIFTAAWLDYEVIMVTHNAEIFEPEIELFLGAYDHRGKEFLNRFRVKTHLLAIRPRSHVVPRAIN